MLTVDTTPAGGDSGAYRTVAPLSALTFVAALLTAMINT